VLEAVYSGGNWPRGLTIYNMDKNWPARVFFYHEVPTDARKYYFRRGDIIFKLLYAAGAPLGWKCTASGDYSAETTAATFEPFYSLDVAPTLWAESLLDDPDAAAGRATLGLGSMATQSAGNVAITGGSVTGLSSFSTAAGAKATLGNGAATAPLNVTERSAAPTSPAANDMYLDDGTNTQSGKRGCGY
jgi:hypothetical protein